MPSPEEIMMMLESQANGNEPDPRMEMMKKLLMGGAAGLVGGPGVGALAMKGLPGDIQDLPGAPPPGMLGMSAEGIGKSLGEPPPGQSKPAPDPAEKARFSEMMKMMLMGPGLQMMTGGKPGIPGLNGLFTQSMTGR